MPIVYLTPEDVSEAQTAMVLEFLNSATSAEEIATRIEIPDELDVGVGVGQNILEAREKLGGEFTDLNQLMDVYHVGPERFTEIVAVIAGIPLPHFGLLRPTVNSQFAHTEPSGDQPKYRISVEPPAASPWVGQEITIVVRVYSTANNRPVANAPVTFESGDMMLGTQFGYQVRQGRVVTSHTGVDGSIHLRLRTLFEEYLSIDQQIALREALRDIDSEAAAPRDIESQLLRLVDQYEDTRNKHLRAAVDIAYRSSINRVANTINQQDYLYRWFFHTGLLRIYINQDAEAISHDFTKPVPVFDATATQVGLYHIPWKEWLLPWYQLFWQRIKGADLRESFKAAKERPQSEARVTAEVLGNAYSFVAKQKGIVGEAIGKQIVDKEIKRFLSKEVDDYTPTTQQSLYPSLIVAGASLSTANAGTLALVNQSRADVEVNLDTKVGELNASNNDILASLNQVNDRLGQIDNNFGTLNQNVKSLQLNMDTVNNDVLSIRDDIVEINDELRRIPRDPGVFDQINTIQNQLRADINGLQNSMDSLTTNVGNLEDSVRVIDEDVQTIKGDVRRIDTNVTRVDTDVGRVSVNMGNLTNQMSTLNRHVVLGEGAIRDSAGNIIERPRGPRRP